MEEIWRDIEGYEGYYQVSNFGNVKQCAVYTNLNGKGYTRKEKIKNQSVKNGYLVVGLTKDGKNKTFLVHRLVALAFVLNPNTEKYDCVNHKDENKQNNCADNLEWCDRAYNDNFGTRNQRLSDISKKYAETHKEKLVSRGQKIRDAWKSGRILGFKGCKHSEATRKLISQRLKDYYANGGVHPMRGVHKYGKDAPRYGAKLSDETKRKISESIKGFKHTDETKRKMSDNMRGRVFMNNGEINKRVRAEDIQYYKDMGFVCGRLTPWQ